MLKQHNYPQNQFVVSQKLVEGYPVICSSNLGYKDFGKKLKYPFHLFIGIDYSRFAKNNLPTSKENDLLLGYEKKLIDPLRSCAVVHWIGRITWNGNREIFCYLNNAKKANDVLESIFDKKVIDREWEYEIKQDEKWKEVDFLLNS